MLSKERERRLSNREEEREAGAEEEDEWLVCAVKIFLSMLRKSFAL